jgi:tetratricopeptide (TPR) repeat protein
MKLHSNIIASVLIYLILLVTTASANEANVSSYDSANAAYTKGDYEKAILLYSNIVSADEESSEVYYNLGNAYYKTQNIALAIVNYERAKRLSPTDEDILTNLQLAKNQLTDDVSGENKLVLYDWKTSTINSITERQWGLLTICLFCTALFLFALYMVNTHILVKKTTFYAATVLSICTIFSFIIAQQRYTALKQDDEGIITAAVVPAKGEPSSSSTTLFILHAGTKVKLTQTNQNWVEISLENGNVGWIENNKVEKI